MSKKLKRRKLPEFDQTPSKNILPTMAKTGVSFKDQMKETTDNCVDADAKNIWFNYCKKNRTVKIKDDGSGMNYEELQKATTIAKTEKSGPTKVGRFGVGLKNTVNACGDSYEIITKQKGVPECIHYKEDLTKNDANNKDWRANAEAVEVDVSEIDDQGTTIIIHLKDEYKVNKSVLDNLKEDFSKTYAAFLNSGNIFVQDEKIKPFKYTFDNSVFPKTDFTLKLSSGEEVKTTIGYLDPNKNGSQDWGVDLCVANRIVETNLKHRTGYNFGLSHLHYSRGTYANLDLSELGVNVTKTGFEKNSIFEEVQTLFRDHPIVIDARKKIHDVNEDVKTKNSVMNEKNKSELNNGLNKSAKILNKLDHFSNYNLTQPKSSKQPHASGLKKKAPSLSKTSDSKNNTKNNKKNNNKKILPTVHWKIGDLKMQFEIEDDQNPDRDIIRTYVLDTNKMTCYINTTNPSYIEAQTSGGINLYSWNQCGVAISECLIEEFGVSNEDAWTFRDKFMNTYKECLRG